jgi:hypothetical protein
MTTCECCGESFEPRFVWQKYCSRECYELERKFRERLRFDQSKVWDWNRLIPALIVLAAILAGCKSPRPRAEIPDPVGANVWLAYDGKQLVWMPIVGGPSGAIDSTSHFGEIELLSAATARYLRSPVSYAKTPAEGAVVLFGPAGATEQAIQASGMNADAVGIANGVLIPAKLPAPPAPEAGRMVFGWTGDTYAAAGAKVYVTWGSMTPAGASNRVFAMPIAGRFTRLVVSTRGGQAASGALEFAVAKAGVAAAGLQVIVAASAPAGVFASDGGVDIAVNDLVQIEITNRATANSAYFNAITAVFEY